MLYIVTNTDTITTEKKVVRLLIDIESLSVNITVRTIRTASDGVEISRVYNDYQASGPDFMDMAQQLPDAQQTIHDNLAGICYSYLQARGVL